MEADIIAAGFRQSEAMHRVRGARKWVVMVILYTIHTTVPNGREVSKLKCANHCMKCYWSIGHTWNNWLRTFLISKAVATLASQP